MAPDPAAIARCADHLRELLAIRADSPLLRLRDAEEIKQRVQFHNTGPDQVPGLVVMSISDPDGAIDPITQEMVVLFNARIEGVSFTVPTAMGEPFALHPVQAGSTDPVLAEASFDQATGSFTVPARTAAVFVLQSGAEQRLAAMIAEVDRMAAAGELLPRHARNLHKKLELIISHLQGDRQLAAASLLLEVQNQVVVYRYGGFISAATTEALLSAADTILALIGD